MNTLLHRRLLLLALPLACGRLPVAHDETDGSGGSTAPASSSTCLFDQHLDRGRNDRGYGSRHRDRNPLDAESLDTIIPFLCMHNTFVAWDPDNSCWPDAPMCQISDP